MYRQFVCNEAWWKSATGAGGVVFTSKPFDYDNLVEECFVSGKGDAKPTTLEYPDGGAKGHDVVVSTCMFNACTDQAVDCSGSTVRINQGGYFDAVMGKTTVQSMDVVVKNLSVESCGSSVVLLQEVYRINEWDIIQSLVRSKYPRTFVNHQTGLAFLSKIELY